MTEGGMVTAERARELRWNMTDGPPSVTLDR
jgi:hypothetical protein